MTVTGGGTSKQGLLFLCVANSSRSQMAEGLARSLAPPGVAIWSAGSAPTRVNPHAIAVMRELGIDLSSQRSKSIDDVPLERVGTVITLCAEEVCPVIRGNIDQLHWPFPDPAAAEGDSAQVLGVFRAVRDQIRAKLVDYFAGR